MPDRLPQREQAGAKELLRDVAYAPSRVEAVKALEMFSKAVDVLEDDWDRMVAFYDFPEAHWKHLRTTNVVDEGRRFVDGKPAPSQQRKVAA